MDQFVEVGDSHESESAKFWINGIACLCLVVVGFVGNTAVLISFHCGNGSRLRNKRRQAFYYYLITFVFWNTGLLVSTILFNCVPALVAGRPSRGVLYASDLSHLIGYLSGNCCLTASVWLAVVLTVERFLAVCRPLQSRLNSPRRRAKMVCALLSVFAVFYNLPMLFELEFVPYEGLEQFDGPNGSQSPNHSVEAYRLSLSAMRTNVYYQLVYRIIGNFVFVSLVPFVLVLSLTVKIVCVVRESNRKRARFRKPATVDNRLPAIALNSTLVSTPPPANSVLADVMLTLIAAKFLIFYTLPVMINIAELVVDKSAFEFEDSAETKILHTMVDLSNLLVTIDGATNSFFYFSWRSRNRFYRFDSRSKNSYAWINFESRGANGAVEHAASECPSARSRSRFEASPHLRCKSPDVLSSSDAARATSDNAIIL